MTALRLGICRSYVCVGLSVTMSAGYEVVQAQVACPVYQVTRTVDVGLGFENNDPAINAAGTRIAFVSAANLAGENPGLFAQIYLYDTGSNSFTQITDVNADNWCEGCPSFAHVNNPSISDDGTRIVFESNDDLTGDNADHNKELFLYRATTGQLAQITNTLGIAGDSVDNVLPAISGNGRRIAFVTQYDPSGALDDNGEIAVYDVPSDSFVRVTDTEYDGSSFNTSPTISRDGESIGFVSRFDLTGANPNHYTQLFMFDYPSRQTAQLTHLTTAASVHFPSISADGSLIAFGTTAANTGCVAPSGNADGNSELVRMETSPPNSCRQITRTTVGASDTPPIQSNHSPDMSANGGIIAFLSMINLTGQNGDTDREVFRFDATSGSFLQVSKGTNGGYWAAERPSISSDGNRIAFSDLRNPTGQNGDGNRELFLAACVTPPNCDGQPPTIVGTPFNDTLTGTAGVDVIVGLDGADTIEGLGGNDRICGGNGNDTLRGGGGNDRVFGQGGNDTLNGQAGTDVCNGGAGTDTAATCETVLNVP
jgi:Tol biopolymer transport system component